MCQSWPCSKLCPSASSSSQRGSSGVHCRPQPVLLIQPPEHLCAPGKVDFTRWGRPEWRGRREFNSAWKMFCQERRLDKISSFQIWAKSPSLLAEKVCFLIHHCESTSSTNFCLIKIPSSVQTSVQRVCISHLPL